ncbi:tRNA 4-thiouridine(8) synthase ThiI [bacterium]|nr:tRNA 4-thiouridine(8) synthase ThiI [bacterium]
MDKKNIKAVGIVSGGLDSILAVRILSRLNVDVTALHFQMKLHNPLEKAGITQGIDDNLGKKSFWHLVTECGAKLEFLEMGRDYLTEVLHNPPHGYGKNVNPCIDCHLWMLKKAREKMIEYEADFVFSGEVLGQRPMSQLLPQLTLIAKQSGLGDRLLRPLSANLLPDTFPVKEGLIDKSQLYNISGRSRQRQMRLASELGMSEYPSSGGGCAFTDPNFSKKVKELWSFEEKENLDWQDYIFLRVGRHLRIDDNLKLIVGRNERENIYLERFKKDRIRIEVCDYPGPTVLIDREAENVSKGDILIGCRIAARYSDAKEIETDVNVNVLKKGFDEIYSVMPFKAEEVAEWVIS